MSEPSGTSKGPALRRVRKERLLFGVCGGLASYFGLDPTVVRVGFVVAGLLPPLGGLLLLAYVAMAIIIPEEGADELPGREQVKANLTSLRTEVVGLAETVRARITREPRESTRPAAPDGDAAEPAEPAEPRKAA